MLPIPYCISCTSSQLRWCANLNLKEFKSTKVTRGNQANRKSIINRRTNWKSKKIKSPLRFHDVMRGTRKINDTLGRSAHSPEFSRNIGAHWITLIATILNRTNWILDCTDPVQSFEYSAPCLSARLALYRPISSDKTWRNWVLNFRSSRNEIWPESS